MKNLRGYTLLVTLLCCSVTHAASSTIFGKSTNAKNCYDMAKQLSRTGEALLSSVDSCDRALLEPLSSRDRASTLVNRGLIFARQERHPEAMRDYRQAIKLHSKVKPTAIINVGNSYFLQGEFSKAVEQYTKALTLEVREDHAAILNRGMAFEMLGDFDKAEQDYLAALEIIPEWESATIRLERVRGKMKSH